MVLCSVCAPLDLRALLLRSLESKEREPKDRMPGDSDGHSDCCDPDLDSPSSEDREPNDREPGDSGSYELKTEDSNLEVKEPKDRIPGESVSYDPDSDGSNLEDREPNDQELCGSDLRDSELGDSELEDTWRPGFHPYLSRYFKHHNSLIALRASAQSGCDLCSLIWATWDESLVAINGSSATEEDLSHCFSGPLYIDIDSWYKGPDGRPEMCVSIYPPSTDALFPRVVPVNVCKLEGYATRGHSPSDRARLVDLLLKDVLQDRTSQAFLALCSGWFNTCLSQHQRCLRTLEEEKALPTRVIDVGNDRKDPSLLVAAKDQIGRWAALSYCWGGDSDFKLTTKTINEFQSGRPLGDFPRTIQDAIIITRSLEIQYLWVDALCILQDSRDDWVVQSVEMFSVYANACLTVAAADSPNVNSGFLGWRNAPRSCSLPWQIPDLETSIMESDSEPFASEEQKVYLRPAGKLWDDYPSENILDSRGWTYQESLFANRRLVFTKGQTIWECSTCQETEAGGIKLDGDALIRNNPHTTFQEFKALSEKFAAAGDDSDVGLLEYAFGLWYTIVCRYSQRALTFETDRPVAIASMARYFHEVTGFNYFAGLWDGDMLRGLLWESLIEHKKSTSVYIGPSWSWVAHASSCVRIPNSLSDAKVLASVKHVMVDYVFPKNPFGPIKSAVLTICAPFCRFSNTTLADTLSSQSNESSSAFSKFAKLYYEYAKANHSSQHQHVWRPDQDFVALQIAHRSGVVMPDARRSASIELLFLESVNRYSKSNMGKGVDDTALVCRRIGRCTLKESALVEFVSDDFARLSVAERAAYKELVSKEWPVKDIVII